VSVDGEFVVDEKDLGFAGYGVTYSFTRHYRSGISYQSPLGYGWSHNYNLRLVNTGTTFDDNLSCKPAHGDAILLTERMERVRFTHQSTSGSVAPYLPVSGNAYQLSYDHSQTYPWQLVDGSGLPYTFEPKFGTLASVSDAAGHSVRVFWDSGWP